MSQIYNLAIIGAGPAGIATAVEGYLQGIRNIILLEKGDSHNATIRKYYKENKRVDKDWKGKKIELDGQIYFVDGTKESTLDFFDQIISKHSVEFKTQIEVTDITKREDGFFEITANGNTIVSRYVVVTIGRMGKPNMPSYKIPPTIKKHIGFTLEGCSEGENILVVGGGDSAIEYALELCGKNEVTMSNRRETFRRANPTNQRDITNAVFHNELKAIMGVEIESIEDELGKVKVIFSHHNSQIFDRVIYAIGGTTPSTFLKNAGIKEEDGVPCNDENYQTNIPGLFVAGDITQESGGSIALGLNHGYAIACYIQSKEN